MSHTTDPATDPRAEHQDGEFAALFARKARTPLRGFLPGRRVWAACCGTAVGVLVIAGTGAAVSRIDWGGSPDAQEVTTASAHDTEPSGEPSAAGNGSKDKAGTGTATGTTKEAPPRVVYLPASGGGTTTDSGSSSESTTKTEAKTKSGTTDTSDSSDSSTTTEKRTTTTTPKSAATTDFLWSDGSVDSDTNAYWDQSTVTVKSTKPLTGLKVVVAIGQTGGVASSGTWSSLGDQVAVGTNSSSSRVGYVFTLKSGVTLAAGTYVFKVQYNHDEGDRDATHDQYNFTATTAEGSEFRTGRF
ncbi:hypothetical protein OK074_2967 [Actinobacteria bacterium OK074]|nr:hypothetical protein OK074_2967 [Actinobacteria bacterium OK074]